MTRFLSPRAFRGVPADEPWAYLGKDARLKAALTARAGAPPRPIGPLLAEEYARLKGPLLDFVAGLGRGRRGDPRWWCSLAASRIQASTDLFLLLGYLGLARRLQREGSTMTVVVEDPWLLSALEGRGAPLAQKASLLAQGLLRRAWWLLRMLKGWAAARRACRGSPPAVPPGSVLLYSHLIPRSLVGETGWLDPFLPGLQEELEAGGARVVRLTYPDITGLEREAAARSTYLYPLMLEARPSDFLRLLAEAPPALPASAEIGGLPAGTLLEREWWHDFSRRGRQAYLLLHEAARRLFARAGARSLVFSWESQPQDKMLVLAAREAGLRSVGSQNTTVPRFQLPYFLGEGEARDAPLPDLLLTTGRHALESLAAGGWPRSVLRDGGTRRYAAYLADGPLPRRPPSGDVLVLLPVDKPAAWMMLQAIAAAYPDAGREFRFHVRVHPSDPLDTSGIPFPFVDGGGPLEAVLDRCGVMLFSGSTAGIDGLLGGRQVLRYRPDASFELDPCDMFDDSIIPSTDDAGLRASLEALRVKPLESLPPGTRERLREVFSPVDGAAWREAVLKPS